MAKMPKSCADNGCEGKDPPKEKGGLGIKKIRLQNEALLLKHLDSITGKMCHGLI